MQRTVARGHALALLGGLCGIGGVGGCTDPGSTPDPGALAKISPLTVAIQGNTSEGWRLLPLEKQIARHQQKLADFIKNPTPRPGTEHLSKEIQQRTIEGRIRHLEKEIQTFRENIEKVRRSDQ